MKLSIHKKFSSLSTMLATGIVTLSALTSQAEAGVIWTFGQDGADVTATVGGAFSIDVESVDTTGGPALLSGVSELVTVTGASYAAPGVGVYSSVGGVSTADAGAGSFGHFSADLYWDAGLGATLTAGTDVAGGGTVPSVTWNSTTIDTIFGGGFFDNGPVTAWTLTGGAATDTISYVAAVPEPSSSALLVSLGTLALLARRRR
jgi:hypothetical protein